MLFGLLSSLSTIVIVVYVAAATEGGDRFNNSIKKGQGNVELSLGGPLLGQHLLEEYMIPGLFLSVPIIGSSSSNNNGNVMMALLTNSNSFLSISKSFNQHNNNNNNETQNSRLTFPFPWKIEAFLPQKVLLPSSTSTSSSSSTSSSVRFVTDLSRRNNNNNTLLSLSTNSLFDPSQSQSQPSSVELLSLGRPSSSWNLETEMMRPNWFNSGVNFSLGTNMTIHALRTVVQDTYTRIGTSIIPTSTKATTSNTSNDKNTELKNDWRMFRRNNNNNSSTNNNNDDVLHIRAAAGCKESIIAANVEVPLSHLLSSSSIGRNTVKLFTTDTMLSLNLNSNGSQSKNENENEQGNEHRSPPPPLWLTLKQSQHSSTNNSHCLTLNISQILTFDREIWNILEERAPTKIRNHLGWVCQIERTIHTNSSNTKSRNSNSNSNSSSSIWSVGASGQLNRNVAAKVIIESKLGNNNNSSSQSNQNTDDSNNGNKTPSSSSASSSSPVLLKFAIILKRWIQPRATLSLINSIDLLTGRFQFIGIGLEIENHNSTTTTNNTNTVPMTTISMNTDDCKETT